jgi:hypothetical protein
VLSREGVRETGGSPIHINEAIKRKPEDEKYPVPRINKSMENITKQARKKTFLQSTVSPPFMETSRSHLKLFAK